MSFQATITDKAKYVSSLSLFIKKTQIQSPKFLTNMNETQTFQSQALCVHCCLNETGTHSLTRTHTHNLFLWHNRL